MAVGKRRRGKMVTWRISVPPDIAVNIELSITDPTRGEPIYGLRSQLICALLERYLQEMRLDSKTLLLSSVSNSKLPDEVKSVLRAKIIEILETSHGTVDPNTSPA